jgi:hypothetical protein
MQYAQSNGEAYHNSFSCPAGKAIRLSGSFVNCEDNLPINK